MSESGRVRGGWAFCLVLLMAWSAGRPAVAQTLAKVRAAGQLSCGLNREEPEYSNLDAHGNRALLDVDLCKAVAVAVLGPNAKFTMTPYSDEADSLKALAGGAVDLVSTATPSLTHSAGSGLTFGRTMLFDSQALMVNTAAGIHTAQELTGKKVCYLTETEIELNLQAWMRRQGIAFLPFPFQEEGEMEAAFLTGNCLAISADATQLAYERIAFRGRGRSYEILPDVLSKDPLATATRSDDAAWSAIVRWVDEALVSAEEWGVTQGDATAMRGDPDPAVQRLLGVTAGIGRPLGLDDGWALRVVEAVGNYGEIFARDLGPNTPMRLVRGQNRLWTDGGLMVAAPLR